MKAQELNRYKILIKEDAGACNVYAAENLQKYISLTCRVELEIVRDGTLPDQPVFSIGETKLFSMYTGAFDRSVLTHDGFRIFKNGRGDVFFDSLSHRGVMYAVFDFIEVELGVRFLTSRVEHIPTVDEIDLSKTDRVSLPSFEMGTENYTELFGQGGPASAVDIEAIAEAKKQKSIEDNKKRALKNSEESKQAAEAEPVDVKTTEKIDITVDEPVEEPEEE